MAAIAPVGHSRSSSASAVPGTSGAAVTGPRQESAYSSGRFGQRVVTTPSRSPRSTQMLTAPPPRGSQGGPRDGQAEAGLDEREVREDVTGEDLVHQHQVVE